MPSSAKTPGKPPIHETFTGLAERTIRKQIFDGELSPGDRINEVELAETLGISRGPVREAIQSLASRGLLTVRSHHGATVKVIGAVELRELYEVRLALEIFAVRDLADRVDQFDVQPLSGLLEKTRKLLSQSRPKPYPRDLDFHLQLMLLTGNSALIEMHTLTLQKIELARSFSAHNPSRAREALKEHEEVLQCLVDRRKDAAAASMEVHLRRSLQSAGERVIAPPSTT